MSKAVISERLSTPLLLQGLLYAALLVGVAGYMVTWLLFTKAYLEVQEPDVRLLVWTAAAAADQSLSTRFGADIALCGCNLEANNSLDVCQSYSSEIPSWGRFAGFSCVSLPPAHTTDDAEELFIPTALQACSFILQ